MITSETYIKNKNRITSMHELLKNPLNYFTPLGNGEVLDDVEDFNYVEGAIILKINNVSMLGFQHWDLVDQLWVYLITSVEQLIDGKQYFSFYFPDQPLKFEIKAISSTLLLVSVDGKTCIVDRNEFFTQILEDARHFFFVLKGVSDTQQKQFNTLLDRISNIFERR